MTERDEETSRRPRAIRLESERGKPQAPREQARKPRKIKPVAIELVPDDAAQRLGETSDLVPVRETARGFGWGSLLLAALGGLVSLGAGLAVDQLVRDLFERSTWLGWSAAVLAALAALAAIAIAMREVIGIARLRTIHRLQQKASEAWEQDDPIEARKTISQLVALYETNPRTAHGRNLLAQHKGEIIDGSDLIELAERDLVSPLDAEARAMILSSAKRVSVVTAVSPRAIVDLAFVLMENLRLIRRLSALYGGRPGTIGFMRLTRSVLAHLAATGAIALGDSLIQQLVGHGLAAKLSARLGEGVVNGMLTARIGIAAMELCRPLPFRVAKRPGISDFVGELLRLSGNQGSASNKSPPPPQDS